MKFTTYIFCAILMLITTLSILWYRAPFFNGEWNKQTLYVGLLDALYGASKDDRPYALWTDDDSGTGVFEVMKIAKEIGIRPCFGVIADRMAREVADSLATWQQQGKANIVLHGLRHERWTDWSEEQIEDNIRQSRQRLHEQGFDTARILKMVIPPHSCNTRTIRNAIQKQGYQMISGASLINPDRHVFLLGRIAITPQTDISQLRLLLQKAFKRKCFVIFSTHSSTTEWFSSEKTQEALRIAKEIGFEFDISK